MHFQMECKNYIRILHKTEDNRMYVCGTNAFDPECDYMVRQIQSSLCLYSMLYKLVMYILLHLDNDI